MGINDFVSSILAKWGKRKREDNSNEVKKKVKLNNEKYTITPVSKDPRNKEKERNYFNIDEELETKEFRNVEFKEGGFLFKKDVLIQYINRYASAFLNSEGGVLLAGVNDKGIVTGVKLSDSDWTSIVQTLKKQTENFRPLVSPSLYSYKYYEVVSNKERKWGFSTQKLSVVEIKFKPGVKGELYESPDHNVYVRKDGSVQGPLRPLDIKTLVITKYNITLRERKNGKNNEDGETEKLKKIEDETEKVKQIEDETEKSKTNDDDETEKLKERLKQKNIQYITID